MEPMQKATGARRDHIVLLGVSVLVAAFLSLGLFALGARSPQDALASAHATASRPETAVIGASDPHTGDARIASERPVAMGAPGQELAQRKLLAVMLTALAAVLLWLWRELPLRRRSRQRY